jgi:hypothetical protein
LGKVVERFSLDEVIIHDRIHANQYAYHRGKSTETAFHALVNKIEEALQFGEYELVILFDNEELLIRHSMKILVGSKDHGLQSLS